eukprot:8073642-Alexandrium_andersonii.AAC.1
MDTAGWVLAQDCVTTDIMARYGPLSDEALRVLAELENEGKIRFLMAWGNDGRLYLRAAQAHSGGLGAFIDMTKALEVFTPDHPQWCPVGLRGTKLGVAQSITRSGLDTKHSVGKSGEKRCRIHM